MENKLREVFTYIIRKQILFASQISKIEKRKKCGLWFLISFFFKILPFVIFFLYRLVKHDHRWRIIFRTREFKKEWKLLERCFCLRVAQLENEHCLIERIILGDKLISFVKLELSFRNFTRVSSSRWSVTIFF